MATIVQQRSLGFRPADWTDSVTLDQVYPASGVTSLELDLAGTLSSQASFFNSDLSAGTVSVGFGGTVELDQPSGAALLSTALGTYTSAQVASGAGGTLSGSNTNTASTFFTTSGTGTPIPAALVGTGTVQLPVKATARVDASGPGNMVAEFFSQIAATVTSTTQATPSGSSGGRDSSGSVITLGSAPSLPNLGRSLIVDSAVQTVTLAAQTTGWTDAIHFAGFNPSLGTLSAVVVSIIVNSGATLGVENLDGAASSVTVGQNTTVKLQSGTGAVLANTGAQISTTRALGAYDGTLDAAGASGATVTGLSGTGTSTQTLNDTASLAAFNGAGSISLSASDVGATTIDGPGNLAIATGLQAGATISVQYDYTPTVGALFDASYYLTNNPDVAAAGVDPYQHYLDHGAAEGRNPNAYFDTKYYLTQNPDVAASGMNPLLHFANYGYKEGRDPSLLFSDSKYVAANPSAAGSDPLQQFEQQLPASSSLLTAAQVSSLPTTFLTGGTLPADPLVDAAYYDKQLGATLIPTGTAAAQQAAWSYDATGWQKGLNPDAFFDTNYYLSHNPDVAAAHVDPLLHYETYGWHEGRDPSAAFSTNKYLAAYSDVRASGVDPLLQFIQSGQAQGRTAFSA